DMSSTSEYFDRVVNGAGVRARLLALVFGANGGRATSAYYVLKDMYRRITAGPGSTLAHRLDHFFVTGEGGPEILPASGHHSHQSRQRRGNSQPPSRFDPHRSLHGAIL